MLEELKKRLDENCVDFSNGPQTEEEFHETIAMCDEAVLDSFLENGSVSDEDIRDLIAQRKLFPCFFGSALKMTGVEEFLHGFTKYSPKVSYPDSFGAKIYKISRDDQGNRLTYLKVTGGRLRVKDLLTNRKSDKTEDNWEEDYLL